MTVIAAAAEADERAAETEDDAAEYGECPTCGPDQEADSDGRCSWCGRGLVLGPDLRSDPNWWTE